MSRGRKAKSGNITQNWEKAFFNSLGQHINLINKGLAKNFKNEPLSKHIKIVGGYAFKNIEYKKTGIPIIRISDFNDEKIILENVVYYEESRELERYLLKESDIIIALTGGTIGKLGIVQGELGKLYLNQRVGKFDILNPDEFEKEYIYWIARGIEGIVKNLAWGAAIPNVSSKQIEDLLFPIPTKEIQNNIIKFLNDLKSNTIDNESVYFDSEIEKEIISVQSKQVKILEITKHYVHQLTLIENLNQAILQEAVQGKLLAKANDEILFSFPPVKAGGNSGGDSMNSPHFQMGGNNMGANFQMGENNEMGENNMGENNKMNKSHFQMGKNNETGQQLLECIKAEKAKSFPLRGNKKVVLPPIKPEEIPFEIPENWVWCRLGEITNIQRGKSPNYSETGIFKMLNQKCVRWYNVDLQYCKSINEEWFDSISENFKVKENDVLVNSTGDGTIGRSAIAHKEVEGYIFDSHILRISSRINQLLICYYINSNYGQALVESTKGATSTKQTELGATNLANFVFPLPPLSEQKLIVAEIERQLAKTKALKAQIASNQANTEALLKALLSRAFEVV